MYLILHSIFSRSVLITGLILLSNSSPHICGHVFYVFAEDPVFLLVKRTLIVLMQTLSVEGKVSESTSHILWTDCC